MKYPCDMIRDLMPLCADGAASDASAQAVREHIGTCTECARIWGEEQQKLDLAAEAPAPQEKGYAKAAKKYRKKWLFRLLAVFFCGFLATWSAYQLYAGSPYFHGRSTVDGAIKEALSGGNGKRLLSGLTNYRVLQQYDAPDGSGTTYFVTYILYNYEPSDSVTPVTVTKNQKGLYVGKADFHKGMSVSPGDTEKLLLMDVNGTTSFGFTRFTGLPVTEIRLTVSGKEQRFARDSEDAAPSFYFLCNTPKNSNDITGEALDADGNVLLRLRTAGALGYESSDARWIWDFVSPPES